jgi:hypothetical protein
MTPTYKVQAECFYKGRLANSGYTGDANANAFARVWQELVEQLLAALSILWPLTLDQGNGFGQPSALAS